MEDSDEVPEQLKCPVCFEIPEKEIFLCKNGHTICKQCCANIPHCPQCRVPYEEGKVRNRPLESLLDTLKVTCPHRESGCVEKVAVKLLKRHSENCIYNGHCIQFCRQLGYSCDFWVNTMNVLKSVEHFQQNHDFLLLEETRVAIHMENFRECASKRKFADGPIEDSMWQPMLLKKNIPAFANNRTSSSPVEPTFLILSLINGDDETISWLCFAVGEEGTRYQVEFRIKNKSDETEELRWKVPAAKILKSKLPVQMPLLRIPIELLLSHYTDENGSLLVNVFLTQGPRNPASLGVLEEADSVDTNVSLEPIWTFNVPFKREMPLGSRTKRPAFTIPESPSTSSITSAEGEAASTSSAAPVLKTEGAGYARKLQAAAMDISDIQSGPSTGASPTLMKNQGEASSEGREHMQKLMKQLTQSRHDNDPCSSNALVSPTSVQELAQQQQESSNSGSGDSGLSLSYSAGSMFEGRSPDEEMGPGYEASQQNPFSLTRETRPWQALSDLTGTRDSNARRMRKPVRRLF